MGMNQRLLFVGVGQAGGNVANQLEKKGYLCTYINTSNEDLSTLKTDSKNKFHIPTATGCSKNKSKAMTYVQKYAKSMIAHIDSSYPNQDIVYFVFSAGGGTGAGIAPILLDVLSLADTSKHYGAITIMPSQDESIKCMENAIGTYSMLSNLQNLKSLFLIDNNKGEKLALNRDFVSLFDRFINMTVPDNRGIIDTNELETLLTEKGLSVILDGKESVDGTLHLSNNVFAEYPVGCTNVGLLCKNRPEKIQAMVEAEVGCPYDYYIGYSDTSDLAVVTGMNYSNEIVERLHEMIKMKKDEQIQCREGSVRIKNPLAEQTVGYKAAIKPNDKAIDYNSILDKYFC